MNEHKAERLILESIAKWENAASYADLLRLNIEWLQGRLFWHPESPLYVEDLLERPENPGLQEETSQIVKALIALNQLGYFTVQSQPGLREEVLHYKTKLPVLVEQRAFVSGFLPRRFVPTLVTQLETVMTGVFTETRTGEVVVTRTKSAKARAWKSFTWVGRPDSMENLYSKVGRRAGDELLHTCESFQVYDKEWTGNTLWQHLVRWLGLLNRSE